jgi:hypothetical protein
MKFIIFIFMVSLSGCAQLMHGERQPVVLKDYKQKIYFTSCGGAVEEWGSCKDKASETCVNGYSIINRLESAVGGRRELTFQCK